MPALPAIFGLSLLASLFLFVRPPGSGFVFDEQEALLASPVLGDQFSLLSVFRRDFWGLPAASSIGSYRPLPVLLWKLLVLSPVGCSPFALGLLNVCVHAANATLAVAVARRLGLGPKKALFAGMWLVSMALSSEAVGTLVGLADLLATLFLLLALLSTHQKPPFVLPLVFVATLLALLSKETALASVLLVPGYAFWVARAVDPKGGEASVIDARCGRSWSPGQWLRVLGAWLGPLLAVAASVLVRREWFLGDRAPVAPPLAVELPGLMELVLLLAPPRMPLASLENPALDASALERVTTALSVFGQGVVQALLPWHFSADYSAPRQTVEQFSPGVVLGLGLVSSLVAGVIASVPRTAGRARAFGFGMFWLIVAWFPISGALVVLPTIRAERLFYLPSVGLVFGVLGLTELARGTRAGVWIHRSSFWLFFLLLQAVQARAYATRYASDLVFWRAATFGPRPSAKAELNYGIMLGARGDLAARMERSAHATRLAPRWPTAHVYLGDARCRAGDKLGALDAWERGFRLDPDSRSLSALALQCAWDHGYFADAEARFAPIAERHPGSWLGYLLGEVRTGGELRGGVPLEYRPRGYNEPARSSSQ